MRRCIELARSAADNGEVPVGAIIVREEKIIAEAGNAQIGRCDPTAHAEVLCLRAASEKLRNYRLPGCTLYSTIEPCLMCAGAIIHARIELLVFGASEPRAGAVGGEINYFESMSHVHRIDVLGGVLAGECKDLMQSFFRARRQASAKRP